MRARLGLQGRMTVSFAVATVAIVLFVEALAGAFVLSHLTTGQDVTVRALDEAGALAKQASGTIEAGVGAKAPAKAPDTGKPGPLTLVLDTTGHVLSTNDAGTYPVGTDATRLLPAAAVTELRDQPLANPKGAAAIAQVPNGQDVWALVPVRMPLTPGEAADDVEVSPKGGPPVGVVAFAYVETPVVKGYVLTHKLSSGVFVLLLTVPVGVIFGLVTTRSLRRRVRRLADASQAVAAGDLATQVAPGSGDEGGQLERNFNDMTARLREASERELALASQNARLAERSRISRELHDSISQELFSLAMLAGGLQRALPETSPLQPQITRIAETVATALHEMRALVLDLHPSALEDKGLRGALEDVCAAYRARGAFELTSTIGMVELDGAAQHALLRVAQEALSNAARHASATQVDVSLTAIGGGAELVVADNGGGFQLDAGAPSSGVGLQLMRERVGELGGVVTFTSQPGVGTTVRVVLTCAPTPGAWPAPADLGVALPAGPRP
jgi:signal transduction histidine kinase